MNIYDKDVLKAIFMIKDVNQRRLAKYVGCSLGRINKSLKKLIEEGYLDSEFRLTGEAIKEIESGIPKKAIILAAGYGMRMVPINVECPKALLDVKGEVLIERIIRQLHEVGITQIYVVVGFMKERFEYLIDEYGVELIINTEYSKKNNLHSLSKAACYLDNAYIVPSDIWCSKNPFNGLELYSWYMVNDDECDDSYVRVNRKKELAPLSDETTGNGMVGIAYITQKDAQIVRREIDLLCGNSKYDGAFWEEILYSTHELIFGANIVPKEQNVEINTYEQLREFDSESNQLNSCVINEIAKVLRVDMKDIKEVTVLKKGMTNRSFIFRCNGKRYIMRIPGEGTEKLINRREEAKVYDIVGNVGISDNVIYINPENGHKLTEYVENARVCEPLNREDVRKAMECLREFHQLKLKVEHEFDVFERIQFYESLWGEPSIYKDYETTKRNVYSLKNFIEKHVERKVLAHIDAVPDNFLFVSADCGRENIRMIDWEYAGMQDPHIDIAMFAVYAMYNRKQVDELIDLYFQECCPDNMRAKIYSYIAVCGLLWSNWCEYKRQLGVEFGEYSLCQYRYAKEYYRIANEEIKRLEG